MSLSSRLEEARRARLGLPHDPPTEDIEVEVDEPADEHDRFSPSNARVLRTGRFGVDCPSCNSRGTTDLVDTIKAVAYLSCDRCNISWETSRPN